MLHFTLNSWFLPCGRTKAQCGLHGIQTVGAFQEGISLGNPLAETVIAVGVVRGAAGQSTAGQPGQLTLAPGCGHAVIAGGTAHGVVGNAAAAEAGQLVRRITEGSGNRSAAGDVLGVVIGILLDA